VGGIPCSSGYRVYPVMLTDSDIDNLINEFLRVHAFPNSNKASAKAELKRIIEKVRSEAYEEGSLDGFDKGYDSGSGYNG
jgi:flagellar biosynthesis/type III secretory pathway protein FliH